MPNETPAPSQERLAFRNALTNQSIRPLGSRVAA
jgi:hypothetical protein